MKEIDLSSSKTLKELGLKKHRSLAEALAPKQERVPADIEVVFVVDTTGSMGQFIAGARNKIVSTLDKLAKNIRIAACLIEYRDHPPEESTFAVRNHGLMSRQSFEVLLGRTTVMGGGDAAEAILDGLNAVSDLHWSTKIRLMFLVGDAPAHGIKSENCSDVWRNGCPCQLTLEMVAAKVKATSAKFYAICLDNIAAESFREIAAACGGEFTNFEDAGSAIDKQIIPLLEEAASKFLLEKGKQC